MDGIVHCMDDVQDRSLYEQCCFLFSFFFVDVLQIALVCMSCVLYGDVASTVISRPLFYI